MTNAETQTQILYGQLAEFISESLGDNASAPEGDWSEFYLDRLSFKDVDSLLEVGHLLTDNDSAFTFNWYKNAETPYRESGEAFDAESFDILTNPNDHIRLVYSDMDSNGRPRVLDVMVTVFGKVKLNCDF